jgi:hypothetical protein
MPAMLDINVLTYVVHAALYFCTIITQTTAVRAMSGYNANTNTASPNGLTGSTLTIQAPDESLTRSLSETISIGSNDSNSTGNKHNKKQGTGRRLLRVFMRKRKDKRADSETGSTEGGDGSDQEPSDTEDEEISPELAMLINALAST